MFKVFNSLTRKIEEFKSGRGRNVTMYNCGPTVYDYPHIGNLRAWIFADILRRYLEYSGYKVKQVMNITDVGHMLGDADTGTDKLEAAAEKEKSDPLAVARKYEEIFFRYLKSLNCEPAAKYPRASEHVKEMIKLIGKLLKNGLAYQVGGDVYFDVTKFPGYGRLSGNSIAALEAGARVEVNPKKRHPADFALWIENARHVLQWKAPWGTGYPGWHIECSAMSMKYLGETIDIHTGAEDNKFPHHECEIAQSEGATGKTFVRYWMHLAHLLVDGQKMSKSLGNFYSLDDLLAKKYEPRVIRYALAAAHYREQQNFTFAALDAASASLNKLDVLFTRLASAKAAGEPDSVAAARKAFSEAMDDDLNVPKALAAVFDFVRATNAALDAGAVAAKSARQFLEDAVMGVFGIELKKAAVESLPAEISRLIAEREEARAAKNYQQADALRGRIKDLGYEVDDAKDGARVKKI